MRSLQAEAGGWIVGDTVGDVKRGLMEEVKAALDRAEEGVTAACVKLSEGGEGSLAGELEWRWNECLEIVEKAGVSAQEPKRLEGEVGSVSCATLRTQDLLGAFADELERLCGEDAKHKALVEEARWYAKAVEEDHLNENGLECASMIVNEDLMDALEEYAPEGCYFGAHPGDGADFGYWPCEEED